MSYTPPGLLSRDSLTDHPRERSSLNGYGAAGAGERRFLLFLRNKNIVDRGSSGFARWGSRELTLHSFEPSPGDPELALALLC
eukprot:6199455-Pleurochrysis_carterae.AAC.1